MFDWDGMENWRKAGSAEAKKAPRGMSHEHVVPGAIVMFGPDRLTGDRSWTDNCWEVVAIAGPSVLCRNLTGCRHFATVTISIISREVYAAEHFYEEWKRLQDDAKAAAKETTP